MSRARQATGDEPVDRVLQALDRYGVKHPAARIEAYRTNPACIRARIIDPDFKGINQVDRHDLIWRFLETLPVDVLNELSLLVLVTPREAPKSGSSIEFEDPARSGPRGVSGRVFHVDSPEEDTTTVDRLRAACNAKPFRPFVIHLADGRAIPVEHREFIMTVPSGRAVVVAQRDDTLNIVDLLRVTHLEMKPAANGTSKRRKA